LNAQFLGRGSYVVYAGAIMVLFLFVIMLMNLNEESEPQRSWLTKPFRPLLVDVIICNGGGGSLKGAADLQAQYGHSQIGLVKNLGQVLFKEFLFHLRLHLYYY